MPILSRQGGGRPGKSKPAAFYVPEDYPFLDLPVPLVWPAAYLLNLVHWKSCCRKLDSDGYARLHSALLARVVPKPVLGPVKKRLLADGVLECDGRFVPGEKCLGYRLSPEFGTVRRHVCPDDALNARIVRFYRQEDRGLLPVHRSLKADLERVRIDLPRAEGILRKLAPPPWSREAPEKYRERLRHVAVRIDNGDHWFVLDPYGRVHTAVTELKRELRPCLYVEEGGERVYLAELDLANSQPLFLGIAVLDWLKMNKSSRWKLQNRPFPGRGDPYRNRRRETAGSGQKEEGRTALPIKWDTESLSSWIIKGLGNRVIETFPPDVRRYLEACQEGRFYESLLGDAPADRAARDRLKVRFYRYLFGRNKIGEARVKSLRERFEAAYPTVAAVLAALKRKDYRHSSRVLQNYEASFFIDRVCRRVLAERPGLPLYTVHDSILTTPAGLPAVEGIIGEEFARLGVRPTLKRRE